MIVCSGSPVFRNMFKHDSTEKQTGIVEIKKEEADLIELLLRYFYSGKVEGLAEVAHRLLPVADCYEVPELAELCMKSLHAQLSVSTILRDLQLAFAHDHQGGFKRKFLAFADKNLKAVDEHSAWTPQFVSENPEIAMALLKQCAR
ncbi:Speckle-type POZ protein-like isoform X2 [Aphelenchoides fujianensis]|nr:Speckle-type POZ protein-like isoform X2 [Aphelenchoides fujianensis]